MLYSQLEDKLLLPHNLYSDANCIPLSSTKTFVLLAPFHLDQTNTAKVLEHSNLHHLILG